MQQSIDILQNGDGMQQSIDILQNSINQLYKQ